MSFKDLIVKEKTPCHIAIIMDGNGRWAEKRGKIRTIGHKNGAATVKRIVEAAAELEIKYLTLYTFSTENWKRPKAEIDALMSLLIFYIKSEIESLKSNNVRLRTIGDIYYLPSKVQKEINYTVAETEKNTGLNLVLALSYSAKQSIINATQNVCKDISMKRLSISDISEKGFSKYLSTANIPNPELLIRTSGEYRVSNFLLWEIAYTKLYFTETLWPDFDKEEFYKVIFEYQKDENDTVEQIKQLTN